MPNWVQLVEYTAEFYPAPWLALPAVTTGGHDIPIRVSVTLGEGDQCIWVSHSICGRYVAGAAGEEWRDEVQEATARLIADAPVMLMTLARFASLMCGPPNTGPGWSKEAESILAATEDLLRRHVRIGCDPVDKENRTKPPIPCDPDAMERWLKEPWE